ncbi:MAG: hypothetical protein II951_08050 [Bacteroidales bacterium]|jgi:hypothetical protein|nr:hypothetical protein [Bacteroidales bacterium]
MIGEINQQNLYLILPSKVSWLSDMIAEDKGIGIVDAVKSVYRSEVYRQLEDESTKMWHLGPVALYENMTRGNSQESKNNTF